MRSHLVNIDVLINLNDSRLYALERNFQTELKTLQTDFHEEKNEMTTRYRLEKKELGAIIETIEKEEQDRESDVSCERYRVISFCGDINRSEVFFSRHFYQNNILLFFCRHS